MTAALIAAARAVMEAVDFPFDGLRPVWVSRAPKIVLAFARVLPEGTLADAKGWGDPSNGLLGSRALITVLNRDWNENISSGSYDDVRRKCVKFLVEAGIVLKDPDNPNKAPNDSTTGYALSPAFANLLKAYRTEAWNAQLQNFTSANGSLREKLRQEREMKMVPVTLPDGTLLTLSPGEHNRLQANIIEHFLPRYAKAGEVVYIADALARQLHKNDVLMQELGLFALDHRQLPDVIVFDRPNGWVLIIEAVESSGQLSPLRMLELKRLLEPCRFPQVFVSAFPDYAVFSRFANDIAWETEVWIADHPTHLIHYDGKRYLGPYV